jgi:hypothetical protein
MKTTSAIAVLAFALSAFVGPEATEAASLPAKDICYAIGDWEPGEWVVSLKIRPQKVLSRNSKKTVQVVGLEMGDKGFDEPLSYRNQLTGSASYIPAGTSQTRFEGPMIALVGTSTGTRDGTLEGMPGIWSFSYSLFLADGPLGDDYRLRGTKIFQPINKDSKSSDSETIIVDEPVEQIKCNGL